MGSTPVWPTIKIIKTVMEFKLDKGTGYLYCYAPDHPCANKAGKVLEHVHVASQHLGRLLLPEECVHHKDRNRKNNSIENLQVLTIEEHSLLHAIEDRGYVPYYTNCLQCMTPFLSYIADERKFCSAICATLASRKFSIDEDELIRLVWAFPTSAVARMLGVSDVAIAKRCKRLNIKKPPRGYWIKQKHPQEKYM